jgi:hypothetical protein
MWVYTGINRISMSFGCGQAVAAAGEALKMDVSKILAELKAEREQIEEAILSLERLARGRGPRRGRPPAWMAELTGKPRRGRPPGSKNKSSAANAVPKSQAVAS